MPTFIPPTDPLVGWAEEGEEGIFAYLRPGDRGRNVFKLVDGSFTETEPSDPALIRVVYHGGHIHSVTTDEANDLTDAGYGAYIS